MQSLSGVDAGFLYGETAAWHMHAGAVLVLDPSTLPSRRLDLETVREVIRLRIGLLGALRHRLVPPFLGIGLPRWVDVADVDVAVHVHRADLGPNAGTRELAAFAGEVLSRKLDRHRPLWEAWVVERLADGRAALVVKLHHSLVDGVRSALLYGALFDVTPDAPLDRPAPTVAPPSGGASLPSIVAAAASDVRRFPARVARAFGAVGGAGIRVARFARSTDPRHIALPFASPPSPFNGRLTAARSVALCSVPLDALQAVRVGRDVTLNDVVLAVCAGALRSYLLEHGEEPRRPLIAQVPVGVHAGAADASPGAVPGNFVSAMGVLLPVELADPVERLAVVHESSGVAKAVHHALGDDVLLDLVEAAPPALISGVVSAYTRLHLDRLHPPIFNVLVSNVRGAPVPMYLAGARLDAAYAVGPLLAGCGLNITASTYLDSLDVGLTACPDIVADVWSVAAHIPRALDELGAALRGYGATSTVTAFETPPMLPASST